MTVRVFLQESNSSLSHIPLGLIDNPQEGKIILEGNHSEIRQSILDFRSLIEVNAGIDHIRNLFPDEHILN